jgi:hypothetical protein
MLLVIAADFVKKYSIPTTPELADFQDSSA